MGDLEEDIQWLAIQLQRRYAPGTWGFKCCHCTGDAGKETSRNLLTLPPPMATISATTDADKAESADQDADSTESKKSKPTFSKTEKKKKKKIQKKKKKKDSSSSSSDVSESEDESNKKQKKVKESFKKFKEEEKRKKRLDELKPLSSKMPSKSKSRTRARNPDEPVSVYNTKSGVQEIHSDDDIIQEPGGSSIHIMQLLNIKGEAVLTLFDTGANQNLVDGKLAEKLGVKVDKQKPSMGSGVSGSQIWTEYGRYNLALGPTKNNKYFQIKVQGIYSITKSQAHYSLLEINKEVRDSSEIGDDTVLPAYIGGDMVKLLIGLKNAHIQPIKLFTLPSGLGVYKSPFTDIYGSNICYGGPHYSFSSQNQ